ncbi:hypothetical protein [Carnobacterium mobile]|uniref:hypothetical protein n=1 Tax=Carnobacterium mobile TaxID=2750 RepID=UPI000551D0C2|nr:hypothetical protein [Carnobacterium mobile]
MRKKHNSFLFIVCFTAIFMLFGCENNSDEGLSNENNKNIEVIKTVLEKTLNAPDETLLTKLYDSDNATTINQNSSETSVSSNDNTELDQYLEDHYGAYFTDYGYEKFFNTSGVGFNYSVEAEQANYKLKTDKISVVQDKEDPQRYQFEVTVEYTDASNENDTRNISGRVEMENEQINSLDINDDNGLLQEMMSQQ